MVQEDRKPNKTDRDRDREIRRKLEWFKLEKKYFWRSKFLIPKSYD